MRLRPGVVELAVVAEVVRPAALGPVGAEAGQRARHLAHVALGVAAAGAEAEQLLQLARVVLVDVPAAVGGAVEPQQHRRVARDVERELLERAERVAPQQGVLAEHQGLRRPARLAGREPVVPDERHALDQRRLRCAPCGRATSSGRGPRRRAAPAGGPSRRPAPGRSGACVFGCTSESTARSSPRSASRSASPGRGPKPARHSRRRASSGPNGPRCSGTRGIPSVVGR